MFPVFIRDQGAEEGTGTQRTWLTVEVRHTVTD